MPSGHVRKEAQHYINVRQMTTPGLTDLAQSASRFDWLQVAEPWYLRENSAPRNSARLQRHVRKPVPTGYCIAAKR